MLKIGVIGIGNAGNQCANISEQEGFDTYCINTSQKDLDCLNKSINSFLLGDNEGAGKDRGIVKAMVKEHYKELLQAEGFEAFAQPQDIIFIISSTGGGSGSGASIILADILGKVYPNKLIINIGILPTVSESLAAQRNSLEYLKELKKLDRGFLLFDNNKYMNLSPEQIMRNVNNEIINSLLYIRGDYCFNTPYGMIDDADIMKLLSVKGMINFTYQEGFYEKDLNENEKIDSLIIKAMQLNGTCNLDRDKILKRMGVFINLSPALVRFYDPSFSKMKEAFGEALELFEHYFIIPEEGNDVYKNRIGVIMSGLSIPDDRISIIVNRITEVEKLLDAKKETTLLDKISNLDDFHLSEMKTDRNLKSVKNENLDLDLSDY